MNFFKQHILRLENGGGKNLSWRRAFNVALMGGGGLKELAEKTPGVFLRMLGFAENREIIWSLVNLAKDVHWNVLLRDKFPLDFKSDQDIVTKFEWLSDLKGINALIPKEKEKKKRRGDGPMERVTTQGVEMFLLLDERMVESTEGAHGCCHFGTKTERDHDCQWKL